MKAWLRRIWVWCLAIAILATTFLSAWWTHSDGGNATTLQAITSTGGLLVAAVAATFAAVQLRATATSSKHALATELPYLFVVPDVQLEGEEVVILAKNEGRSVCTVSERFVESQGVLPDRKSWLNGMGGQLAMETVAPAATVEAGRITPCVKDRHILGKIVYVNVFGGVQQTWYRFDRQGEGWRQTGGMHWNPMNEGKARHHDDTEPARRKPRSRKPS